MKILVFAGSARSQSLTKKVARATTEIAIAAGAETTFIDLADYPAPIYNGDDEANNGMPEHMQRFKKQLIEHDAFIVVCPEYNGHVPPLLVNTFSWASRSSGDDRPASAFHGKTATIMAASPGRRGGIRVIPRLRDMLAELGVMVVPGFVTIAQASTAFDDSDCFNDTKTEEGIRAQIQKLLDLAP